MPEIVTSSTHEAALAQFASDVQYYLTLRPRQLPSHYLYDELGSALFDAICCLPWYRITRAETRLLTTYSSSILARLPGLTSIVELGPGSGQKLFTLVDSGWFGERLDLRLIDISVSALEMARRTLARLPNVRISAYEAPYEAGLADAIRDMPTGRALALFLGSNIGNFDPPGAAEFLQRVRAALAPGDAFLLGADLVKPERELILAYDDPLGVTAAFNRNLLVRINRELGGDFDVDQFSHRAVWNEPASRVEMHLVSRGRQSVRVRGADAEMVAEIDFEEDESIWTESSYKYERTALVALLEQAGFRLVEQWIEPADRFALTLVEAV